jgi:hypothetical protein
MRNYLTNPRFFSPGHADSIVRKYFRHIATTGLYTERSGWARYISYTLVLTACSPVLRSNRLRTLTRGRPRVCRLRLQEYVSILGLVREA